MPASLFGNPRDPLYGFYYPPTGTRQRVEGVLLCPSGPYEALRQHWALRRIGEMLANAGYPVLRFDYHGTGDSAGEPSEVSVTRWAEDVRVASEELADLSGCTRTSAICYRFGAACALKSELHFDQLVLWDPVVSGASYEAELRKGQQRYWASNHHPDGVGAPGRHELLGYAYPPAVAASINAFELRSCTPNANRVRLVVNEHTDDRVAQQVEAWCAGFRNVNFAKTTAAGDPPQPSQFQRTLFPTGSLKSVIGLFE